MQTLGASSRLASYYRQNPIPVGAMSESLLRCWHSLVGFQIINSASLKAPETGGQI